MSNTLRIISGTLGSRRIKTLRNTNLKPTPEKLREKIFSWLMSDINDARCLDLFAGSGSLGIEAISNGADSCTFVEQNPNLYKNLKENISTLSLEEKTKLHRTRAEDFVRRFKDVPFDIIFFDPPYERDYYNNFFKIFLSKLCKKGSMIYVEQSAHDKVLENDSLQNLKNSKIGEAQGSLFIKK